MEAQARPNMPLQPIRKDGERRSRLIGRSDIGALIPGNIADIVVVRGDPEHNILELEGVLMVIKAGRVVVDNRVP